MMQPGRAQLTRREKRISPGGRVVSRTVSLPRQEWAVLIPEHHPGFIDWATCEANTALLRANWHAPRGSVGGAAREGSALLPLAGLRSETLSDQTSLVQQL